MQPKPTNSKLSMISMPGIPTNWAHHWKTSTKLLWTLALEGGYCYSMVQTLLVAPLDLSKDPSSIAMSMGISIVIVVALATSLSMSSNYCFT
jgi:hypothetical protein